MNLLNKQINTAIAKTTIDNSAACKSSINQLQIIDISGCKIGGNIDISKSSLNQTATVDFKCIQVSDIQNTVAQEIMGEIMGKIKSGLDSESLNNMVSYAESEAKTGFLSAPWGGSDSTSVAKNTYNLDVTNDNTTDIQNIVKNSINVEFNVNDVQECINEIEQKQALLAKNCETGGDLKINNIEFNQGVASTAECLQSKGIAQKITNTAGTVLGVEIEAETKSEAQVDQSAKAESKSLNAGIGDIFSASTDSITGSMSSVAGAPVISSVICSVCILLLIIIGALFYFTTEGGQERKGDIQAGFETYRGRRSGNIDR